MVRKAGLGDYCMQSKNSYVLGGLVVVNRSMYFLLQIKIEIVRHAQRELAVWAFTQTDKSKNRIKGESK